MCGVKFNYVCIAICNRTQFELFMHLFCKCNKVSRSTWQLDAVKRLSLFKVWCKIQAAGRYNRCANLP